MCFWQVFQPRLLQISFWCSSPPICSPWICFDFSEVRAFLQHLTTLNVFYDQGKGKHVTIIAAYKNNNMCSDLWHGSIHRNRENSDWEEILRSVVVFSIFFQIPPPSDWTDCVSLDLQFTDTLRMGFFPPCSHQLQLTCHAEYQSFLFSPSEMKTHGPLILCADRNRNFPNYTGKSTKSPHWSQQAEKYPVWFHYGGNVRLVWSFVAFVRPEMLRWLPSFT